MWCTVSEAAGAGRGRRRRIARQALLAIGLVLAAARPAAASEFGERHAPGAIRDRAQAEQALREADAEADRIARDAAARDVACHQRILVNRCREDVRRDRMDAERELRRVRVEAHDVQRRLDAEDAAARRARAAAQPQEKPVPAVREAAPRGTIAPDEAARNRADRARRAEAARQRAAEEDARAAERADNARRHAERQAEAERRAKAKEAERVENEKRRAERRKQSEAREAQREELRRRAEEAARAAKP